jgi:hypothetical protein
MLRRPKGRLEARSTVVESFLGGEMACPKGYAYTSGHVLVCKPPTVISLPHVLLIPYGTAEWSLDGIAVEGFTSGALRLRTAFPCVAINRLAREPLRLNNSRYDRAFVPTVQADASDEASIVRDYLKGLCRPWDNTATQFLDAYFGFLSDVIAEQRHVLAERLTPYEGLYDYRDWLFSAPKPLPRAHLHALQDGGTHGASPALADFVRVDFAFWLGDRLVAVQSAGSALTPKKAREQTDRLHMAGVEVVPFSPADLASGKAREFFGRLFGPSTLAFWEGDVLPAGPFRTALLDE